MEDKDKILPVGKIESHLLEELVFENIKYKNDNVLCGSGIGDDCAVIDAFCRNCVLSTDPITAAEQNIGAIAVHISCNDIACRGIRPKGIMLAIMLPLGSRESDLREIMKSAGEAAAKLQVEIMGGHTEVTPSVNAPIIVSTAVGVETKKEHMKVSDGDVILMSKSVGLEGINIILSDKKDELIGHFSDDDFKEAKSYMDMLSVIDEGEIAGEVGFVKMHDITEGGVLGGVWEICDSLGKGCHIYEEKINVAPLVKKVSKHFDIDCLRLISSGAMLIVTTEGKAHQIVEIAKRKGIYISEIGKIKSYDYGKKITISSSEASEKDEVVEIAPPKRDELYKVL